MLIGGCVIPGVETTLPDASLGADPIQAVDEQDYIRDPILCLAAARLGQAQAQYVLAQMFRQGQPLERNDEMAARWFRRAAEQGVAEAQYNLGVVLLNGEGVDTNETEAVEWLLAAAERGIEESFPLLGEAYAGGHGVEQDYVQAVRWYTPAATKGHLPSVAALGWFTVQGLGMEQDVQKGIRRLRYAAIRGHAGAQYNLAQIHSAEGPVERNLIKAYGWLSLAVESGFPLADGDTAFDRLFKAMSPSDIAEAKKLADNLRKAIREN